MLVNPWPKHFPKLAQSGFTETSDATWQYNCIAWAIGEDHRIWWPDPDGIHYWPPSIPRDDLLDSFLKALSTVGYGETQDTTFDSDVDRLAIYTIGDRVKHAAKQISDSAWTSKLGPDKDISHTLSGLEGPTYGAVVTYCERASG